MTLLQKGAFHHRDHKDHKEKKAFPFLQCTQKKNADLTDRTDQKRSVKTHPIRQIRVLFF